MFGFGILTYIKIGAAVAVIAVGSYFYLNYNRMQTQITSLKAEIVTLKRVAEIYEHDAQTDKELADEKARVDKLTPADVDSEYERLRNYGATKGSNDNP